MMYAPAGSDCMHFERKAEEAEENGDFEEASNWQKKASECWKMLFMQARESGHITSDVAIFKLINIKQTAELNSTLSKNPATAVAISKGLEKGLKNAGITFDDKTTYAAILYVIEKPQYVSQVVSNQAGMLQVSYLTEPKTMEFVGTYIQKERIG